MKRLFVGLLALSLMSFTCQKETTSIGKLVHIDFSGQVPQHSTITFTDETTHIQRVFDSNDGNTQAHFFFFANHTYSIKWTLDITQSQGCTLFLQDDVGDEWTLQEIQSDEQELTGLQLSDHYSFSRNCR